MIYRRETQKMTKPAQIEICRAASTDCRAAVITVSCFKKPIAGTVCLKTVLPDQKTHRCVTPAVTGGRVFNFLVAHKS